MSAYQRIVWLLHGLARQLPHFRGKYRLFYELYRVLRVPKDEDFSVTMRNMRSPVLARLGSDVEKWVLCLGEYDPHESRLIDRLVKPGWVCVDVGANTGYYTVRLTERVGLGGHVFAIEPYDVVYERLARNTSGCVNVTRLKCAVADAPGQEHLAVPHPGQLHHNATMVNAQATKLTHIVDVQTLDNLWRTTFASRRIDFVKLDVEGYEFKALIGATEMLRACRPYILLEFNRPLADLLGYRFVDLLHFLGDIAGYTAFAIVRGGTLMPLEREPEVDISNLCFLPEGSSSFTTAVPDEAIPPPDPLARDV